MLTRFTKVDWHYLKNSEKVKTIYQHRHAVSDYYHYQYYI